MLKEEESEKVIDFSVNNLINVCQETKRGDSKMISLHIHMCKPALSDHNNHTRVVLINQLQLGRCIET